MTAKTTPKLVLVAESRLSSDLCDYALKVAVRLDLDIIVLFAGHQQRTPAVSSEKMERMIEEEAAAFSARAWRKSVQVTTVVDGAEQETALRRLQRNNPDVCFVLTSSTTDGETSPGQGSGHRLTVIRHGEQTLFSKRSEKSGSTG